MKKNLKSKLKVNGFFDVNKFPFFFLFRDYLKIPLLYNWFIKYS